MSDLKLSDYMEQAKKLIIGVTLFTSPEAYRMLGLKEDQGGHLVTLRVGEFDRPGYDFVEVGHTSQEAAITATAYALMDKAQQAINAAKVTEAVAGQESQADRVVQETLEGGAMPPDWHGNPVGASDAISRLMDAKLQRPGVALLVERGMPSEDPERPELQIVHCMAAGGALNAFDCCVAARSEYPAEDQNRMQIRQLEVELPLIQAAMRDMMEGASTKDVVHAILSGLPHTADGTWWFRFMTGCAHSSFVCDRVVLGQWQTADPDIWSGYAVRTIEMYLGGEGGE